MRYPRILRSTFKVPKNLSIYPSKVAAYIHNYKKKKNYPSYTLHQAKFCCLLFFILAACIHASMSLFVLILPSRISLAFSHPPLYTALYQQFVNPTLPQGPAQMQQFLKNSLMLLARNDLPSYKFHYKEISTATITLFIRPQLSLFTQVHDNMTCPFSFPYCLMNIVHTGI